MDKGLICFYRSFSDVGQFVFNGRRGPDLPKIPGGENLPPDGGTVPMNSDAIYHAIHEAAGARVGAAREYITRVDRAAEQAAIDRGTVFASPADMRDAERVRGPQVKIGSYKISVAAPGMLIGRLDNGGTINIPKNYSSLKVISDSIYHIGDEDMVRVQFTSNVIGYMPPTYLVLEDAGDISTKRIAKALEKNQRLHPDKNLYEIFGVGDDNMLGLYQAIVDLQKYVEVQPVDGVIGRKTLSAIETKRDKIESLPRYEKVAMVFLPTDETHG